MNTKRGFLVFSHSEFATESHNSTTLVSYNAALKNHFQGWQPSIDSKKLGLSGLVSHQKNVSRRFAFKVEIPVDMILTLTYANLSDLIRRTTKEKLRN